MNDDEIVRAGEAQSLSGWDLIAYRMRSGRMYPPDAPHTPESRSIDCPVCGSGGFGDCVCHAGVDQ